MTRAPANLMAVRRLLLDHLDVHENSAAYRTDLDPAEVGVVGDTAHQRQGDSYHLGLPEQRSYGYSVGESPRDKALTEFACGLDVGWWEWRHPNGRVHNLFTFSVWVVAQCRAGAKDTADIREVIYSPDGKTVKRWDRLGVRSTGDDSHLWHTHFSFFRDTIRAGRDQTPLFRRYLTLIGLIKTPPAPAPVPAPDPVEEPDMLQTDPLAYVTDNDKRTVGHVLTDLENLRNWLLSPVGAQDAYTRPAPGSPLALILNAAGRDHTDEAAIVAGVLAGLDPATLAQRIAAALPAEQARQVADLLAARLRD